MLSLADVLSNFTPSTHQTASIDYHTISTLEQLQVSTSRCHGLQVVLYVHLCTKAAPSQSWGSAWFHLPLLRVVAMASNNVDPEKGLITTSASVKPSLASFSPDNSNATNTSRLTPLQLFQLLVGIQTPPSLSQTNIGNNGTSPAKHGRSRTDNIGLYQRAKDQERAGRLAYMSTSFISNTLYMLQIILAATFTALSAYKDSNRVTLTVLGALNTVLAG